MLHPDVVYSVLKSEHAANGNVQHHTHSAWQFLSRIVPSIVGESPEIVAETRNAIHVITFKNVHVDSPVARVDGGFYEPMDTVTARTMRHTLACPVVIDVTHSVYANKDASKVVAWEAVSADTTVKEVLKLERGPDAAAADAAAADATSAAAASSAAPAVAPAPALRRRVGTAAGSALQPTSLSETVHASATDAPWTLREQRHYRQIVQFFVPIMDPAGHFVVKGTEKTIIMQRRLQHNRFFVFSATKAPWTLMAEIRSCHGAKLRSTSTTRIFIESAPNGSGVLRGAVKLSSYIDMMVPIMAACKLLDMESEEQVAACAATGGVLSGKDGIPRGTPWDTPAVHTTYAWILALLRDDADHLPPFAKMSRVDVLQWIGDQGARRKSAVDRAKYVAHLMANEFLPHMGLDSETATLARKAHFMGFMLWRLSLVARRQVPLDVRDHAANKQYDTVATLLALQARQQYRNFRRRVTTDARRAADAGRFVAIAELMQAKRVTDSLVYSLSTGNWGMKKGGSTQTGVAQMLVRMNEVATLSQQRRVNTPLKREGKQAQPRQICTSAWGLMCPAETPEGPACGLVEQLAQLVHVCHGHATDMLIVRVADVLGDALFPLVDASTLTGALARLAPRPSVLTPNVTATRVAVLQHPPEKWAPVHAAQRASDAALRFENITDTARVLVNGTLIGFVADAPSAARRLREARRRRVLPFDVAVEEIRPHGVLSVAGETGSLRRPLFVLDARGGLGHVAALYERYRAAPAAALWRALLFHGAVEYVSKAEEATLLVLESPTRCQPASASASASAAAAAPFPTHCEIHPSCILGLAAAMIPFSQHNQAPRTTYFASMLKQTVGTPLAETPWTSTLRGWYPQRPLVTTWAAKIHGIHERPGGWNALVAVAAYAYNQEDSLIANGTSIDRGMFGCFAQQNHSVDCQGGSGADSQAFEKPSNCHGRRVGNYDKLTPDGMVLPGTRLSGGDAYIGKVARVNEMGCLKRETIKRDMSELLHPREKPAAVTRVTRVAGRDGKTFATVAMHRSRKPEAGDKFSSHHGQKGVLGRIVPACDMPYTAAGLTPDLIINPHAFPSRMTVGQMLETALGLPAARAGETGNGTPFESPSEGDITAALRAEGFDDLGNSIMFDGRTGRRIKCRIFFGPTYYYRVKQMVGDKAHARARGPVHILTQQPMEGRSKDGGLRVGEMERDCLQAHGGAAVAEDRLFTQSDYAEVPLCRRCNLIAMPRAPPDERPYVVGGNESSGFCRNCRAEGTVFMTPMPFATKLLCFELAAMHVRAELLTSDDVMLRNPRDAASVGVPRAVPDSVVLRPRVQVRRRVRFGAELRFGEEFGNDCADGGGRRRRKRLGAVPEHANEAASDDGMDDGTDAGTDAGTATELPQGFGKFRGSSNSFRRRAPDSASYASYAPSLPSLPPSPPYAPFASASPTNSPPYAPASPTYAPYAPHAPTNSPPYAPTSPPYAPYAPYAPTNSPPYAPTSPPNSPPYAPTSPTYAPYAPTSPTYAPYALTDSPPYAPAS
jgi:DNA-directed RNA polymerase II subunit RPB2